MSIFSSISCPKCKQELGVALAFSHNEVRLSCDDPCDYWAEIEVSNEEMNLLKEILEDRKREI